MLSFVRARRGALLKTLLVSGLIGALIAPAALGAGYGRGTFSGEAKSQADQDRPATPVKIKVKGKRARIVEMAFVFACGAPGTSLTRTVETRFVRVRSGPAGGGASFSGAVTPVEGGEPVQLTFSLGLRERNIRGTASATTDVDGLPCMDDVIFNVKKK